MPDDEFKKAYEKKQRDDWMKGEQALHQKTYDQTIKNLKAAGDTGKSGGAGCASVIAVMAVTFVAYFFIR